MISKFKPAKRRIRLEIRLLINLISTYTSIHSLTVVMFTKSHTMNEYPTYVVDYNTPPHATDVLEPL